MDFKQFYCEAKLTKDKIAKLISAYTGKRLSGGLGDSAAAGDLSFAQVEMGLKVEMEHTDDLNIALEIVIDHLIEDPEYYTKLSKIEGH